MFLINLNQLFPKSWTKKFIHAYIHTYIYLWYAKMFRMNVKICDNFDFWFLDDYYYMPYGKLKIMVCFTIICMFSEYVFIQNTWCHIQWILLHIIRYTNAHECWRSKYVSFNLIWSFLTWAWFDQTCSWFIHSRLFMCKKWNMNHSAYML